MTVKKQRVMLEVAYDLISRVHSDICNNSNKHNLAEDTLDILRNIILLDKKLKGGTKND